MFEALLTTTSSEGLSALGSREQRSFELITDTVRERLGEAHAALFAEPVSTEHGDRYDWYAPVPGRAVKLTDLPEEAATALRERLSELAGAVEKLASEYRNEGSAESLRLSEALANALQVPGDDYIYSVGEGDAAQPVLINWAWTSDENRSERGALTGTDKRLAAARASAAAAATAAAGAKARADEEKHARAKAARSPFAWLAWLLGLGWLLLAGMLATIVWLLIAPCALNGPAWLSFCPLPAAEASAELARTAALEDEIDQVQRRIAIADRACQPPPPPPAPAPAPQPRRSDIEDRLDRAGAMKGDLNFSLAWDGRSDVDIAVICPGGQQVNYRQTRACNGRLDVDSNVRDIRPKPIENIFFQNPQTGTYTVKVTLYTKRERPGLPFQVLIRDRQGSQVREGTLSHQRETWTTTFNYTGSP